MSDREIELLQQISELKDQLSDAVYLRDEEERRADSLDNDLSSALEERDNYRSRVAYLEDKINDIKYQLERI